MNKILIFLVTISIFFSCKKENDTLNVDQSYSRADELQIKFARILAPALAENVELRKLIKEESLKKFNNDHDVLYHAIKNIEINEQKVSEILLKYADSPEELLFIETEFPLLTIFVPSLPNFTPKTWNCDIEIPKVAVSVSGNKDIPYYDANGQETIIPNGIIPGFPIVVVKLNERIIVNKDTKYKASNTITYGDKTFSFLDEAFDGRIKTNKKDATTSNSIDVINIEAYNSGVEWHRDYVYYGLTPTKTIGYYKNNYSEFLTSFRMQSDFWYQKISDQSGDPYHIPKTFPVFNNSKLWTDGNYEFKVEVMINSTNGAGTSIIKYFSVSGSDIAEIVLRRAGLSYKIDAILPRTYNPNLEFIPWDLKNYGMAWKFQIYEVDASETKTYFEESSSTFGSNFEISGEIKKIGLKFGSSATFSNKTSFTRVVNLKSDDLGQAILTFDQPIITGQDKDKLYSTRKISTGWCILGVEPKKVFDK